MKSIKLLTGILLASPSIFVNAITIDDSVTFTTSPSNGLVRPSPYTFQATGTFDPNLEARTIPGALSGFDSSTSDKLVCVFSSENAGSVTSITYGAETMQPAAFSGGPNRYTGIYYLDNPPASGGLVFTFTGSSSNGVGGVLLALSGTKAGFGAANSSGSSSVSLTTTAANSLMVASAALNGGSAPTGQTPLTPLWSGPVGSAVGAAGHQLVSASDTVITPTFSASEITAAVEFLAAGTAPQFNLTITRGGSGFNFAWPSQSGKVYDLVSATDLSSPVGDWPAYDDGTTTYADLEATAPTNSLTNVVASDTRRFFAVVERDPAASSTETVRVFLVGGQSNADGRADPTGLPTTPVDLQQPQDDVDFYYKVEGQTPALTTLRPGLSETSGFGPSITFGRALADQLGDGTTTRVALIKYANGGTNLANDWAPGGDATTTGDGPEYVTFQQTVTNGLSALTAAYPAATIGIEGMVWLQGESDIQGGSTMWNAYQTNLQNFADDITATYGTTLPFIIIRLSDGQTALNATGLGVVRTAQQAVADGDPLTNWVNTDGFGIKNDNLHFNAAGQQSIGTAAATSLLGLLP